MAAESIWDVAERMEMTRDLTRERLGRRYRGEVRRYKDVVKAEMKAAGCNNIRAARLICERMKRDRPEETMRRTLVICAAVDLGE